MHAPFDVLIVGCGSSGAALAARLSEDPARRVAVIESGPDYADVDALPQDLRNGNRMSLDAHDWGYRADIFRGRDIRLPRGRVTGGSSAVGATIALRGMPSDFDEWAELGNPEWAWDQVLPYFRALETDLDYGDSALHGGTGPIPIRRWRPDEMTRWQNAFEEACAAAGYDRVRDHNDPDATGFGAIPSNRRDGFRRVSTAEAYLRPSDGRPNLTVFAQATVDRVLVSGDRAVGVEVRSSSGAVETVTAGTVVLASGAINSPAILLRSGIGPREDLEALGIPVTRDLPGVGLNLVDHPRSGIFIIPKDGTLDGENAFLQSILRTTSRSGETTNDMQYYMVNHFSLDPFPHLKRLSQASLINGVMVCQQRPKSRGRLRLTDPDPRSEPQIDLNFLSHPDDVDTMVEGIRECARLMRHDYVMANRERQLILRDEDVDDEDLVRVYLKATLDSSYHPVGTAKMGPAEDDTAVVDQYGRVHGIEGLVVADASIMPNIASANTNLTSIMIGEKVAAQIEERAA
ncbi:mycofactocin system GMC family oxidoreductase MftG [Phycicoccus sp. CSK15P-2]|uniref:mycofactocin dehydrogenase MftG n=1 Tax=Phycicoccus sp. CSK15P-2 TaxID=2807627 RepID=UPI001950355A|nr:mycofactocin system GMC family oxidoreductase MftG [Phycicoccus sp. CSK15P-2]MBM6405599.1 mycofactocin system GMC family oxidoreductase MftG [Phycicoccus sp. CSK15P-2]